ncbi:hypothetical protein SAMN05216188_11962 [Lentzea xinjiangensis]|uniref:CHRD domain-containing protein n=2 Tax=Lentzea xinjiangensis TaxID=402600 RepID=A0A1H9TT36_9PSEU|nr:hypothetical protein SAMN05216188_11962 [Lentzea xinjiangensis]
MKSRNALLAVPAVGLALMFGPVAHAQQEAVQIQLQDLNGTGATGTATLTPAAGGALTVSIKASGMTPNSPHAQHIHGSASGHDFMCPTKSADADGDGFVNTEEGLPAYGDIFVSLTTQGDTTKASGLAVDRMPMANAQGVLTYERTIEASALPAGTIEHLKDLHVVQHGIDVNGNGTYDMEALGESTFAKSLGVNGIPEEATNPATCGMVSGAAPGSVPVGGVETGSGPSADTGRQALLLSGGLVLLGAAGMALVRRRTSRQ